MTIGRLINQVAFYLQKPRTTFVDADGNDMIVAALNQVRKDAERNFEFSSQQAEAWLSVGAASEASLSDAKLITSAGAFGTTACKVRLVDTLYLGDDTTLTSYYPIYHDSKRLRAIKQREQYGYRGVTNYIDLPRFPGQYYSPQPQQQYGVVFQGQRLSFNPPFSTTKKVAMDVVLWMDDYDQNRVNVASSSTGSSAVTLNAVAPLNVVVGTTLLGRTVSAIATNRLSLTLSGNATSANTNAWVSYTNTLNVTPGNGAEDYTDWFTEHGADYLLWAAIVHLNYFVDRFVPQQEGFNAPPEKKAEAALQTLYTADRLLWEQGRIGLRNR